MFLSKCKHLSIIILLMMPWLKAESYDFVGVNASYNFGTIAAPFPDLTLTDGSICVGYTAILETSTYYVRATSANGTGGAFQMINSTNNSYKLNYSVSWAGSSGGSPTFFALTSGQNSSTTFPASLLGILTCSLLTLPNNATLRLQLLSASQVVAKQGSYTDTLTILIVGS